MRNGASDPIRAALATLLCVAPAKKTARFRPKNTPGTTAWRTFGSGDPPSRSPEVHVEHDRRDGEPPERNEHARRLGALHERRAQREADDDTDNGEGSERARSELDAPRFHHTRHRTGFGTDRAVIARLMHARFRSARTNRAAPVSRALAPDTRPTPSSRAAATIGRRSGGSSVGGHHAPNETRTPGLPRAGRAQVSGRCQGSGTTSPHDTHRPPHTVEAPRARAHGAEPNTPPSSLCWPTSTKPTSRIRRHDRRPARQGRPEP